MLVAGEPMVTTIPLEANIDSTHFTDHTDQRVLVTYIDNHGLGHSKDTLDIPIRNRAIIGNHKFEIGNTGISYYGSQSYDEVEEAFADAQSNTQVGKYNVLTHIGSLFNFTAWQNHIASSNFIWVNTHGSSGRYKTQNTVDFPEYGYMYAGTHFDPDSHAGLLKPHFFWLGQMVLPPFNQSIAPSLNFMFIDGCKTLSGDFSQAMYPMSNRYAGTETTKNMAVAGWNVSMMTNTSEDVATVLMGYLMAGWPATKALEKSAIAWYASGMENAAEQRITFGMLTLQGDPYAKVAGIYTGTDVQSLAWHN